MIGCEVVTLILHIKAHLQKVSSTLIHMPEERPFEETHPHLREFTAFLKELNRESERGAVLISAAMIDDLLERTILAFLVDNEETKRLLDGFNAPLGTLASRALAAFSLALLSESEYRDCERLSKNQECVRTQCSHVVRRSKREGHLQES